MGSLWEVFYLDGSMDAAAPLTDRAPSGAVYARSCDAAGGTVYAAFGRWRDAPLPTRAARPRKPKSSALPAGEVGQVMRDLELSPGTASIARIREIYRAADDGGTISRADVNRLFSPRVLQGDATLRTALIAAGCSDDA